MKKGEAVYEFIDKFAYFACAANIVLESYTMTDGEDTYKKLMSAFGKYTEYYNALMDGVEKGSISEEVADTSLKTYINWLQSKSIKSFVEKLQICLKDHNKGTIIIEDKLDVIQCKLRASQFTALDLQEFLEYIRTIEEDNGEKDEFRKIIGSV